MNDLIKVTYDNDRITVSARGLHEFLEIKTEFRKWYPRMRGYGFEENIDFARVTQKCPTLGGMQELTDYQLTMDMAKEISMIQRNEKGKQARQYFIECEKELKKPQSMEDILIYQLQEMKRIRTLSETASSIASETKNELQGIRDVITLSSSNWRKDTSTIIKNIAIKLGGFDLIHDIRKESYDLLEERAHILLETRLTNRRKTMALNGANKTERDKLNKLDIIETDPKVLQCYLAIVKDMAIKYGVDLKQGEH